MRIDKIYELYLWSLRVKQYTRDRMQRGRGSADAPRRSLLEFAIIMALLVKLSISQVIYVDCPSGRYPRWGKRARALLTRIFNVSAKRCTSWRAKAQNFPCDPLSIDGYLSTSACLLATPSSLRWYLIDFLVNR